MLLSNTASSNTTSLNCEQLCKKVDLHAPLQQPYGNLKFWHAQRKQLLNKDADPISARGTEKFRERGCTDVRTSNLSELLSL